jgi:hypothetical protein
VLFLSTGVERIMVVGYGLARAYQKLRSYLTLRNEISGNHPIDSANVNIQCAFVLVPQLIAMNVGRWTV